MECGPRKDSADRPIISEADLAPGGKLAERVEAAARVEHERWWDERRQQGWVFGERENADKKIHPDLREWEKLSGPTREKDADVIRAIPRFLASAGYCVMPDPDPIRLLDAVLGARVNRRDFDMDDGPDREVLAQFPVLLEALDWLHEKVGAPWRAADLAALANRSTHGKFTQVAVFFGTAAIVLAIVQLGLKLTWPSLAETAGLLELIVVFFSAAAVLTGLRAKRDHQWLGQRHKAERLRILKFQALARPELWAGDKEGWQKWISDKVNELANVTGIETMKRWAGSDNVDEPQSLAGPANAPAYAARVLAVYYRHKRLDCQAAYFHDKGIQAAQHWTHYLPHFQFRLFAATIGCVIIHLVADIIAKSIEGNPAVAHRLETVAVWGVVFAAVLPVLGAGGRTYTAAFELARKARTFAAKHKAMQRASQQLDENAEDLDAVFRRIARDEAFLEQEHRDWLRLLLDVEWFL